MSEFTNTGQRISSRHHSSTISRQVEELQVLNSMSNSASSAQNQNENQKILNTTPGVTTPTDQLSLPLYSESPTMPFASDQTPISPFPSNKQQNTSPNQSTQHQPDIESSGVADTSTHSLSGPWTLVVKNATAGCMSGLARLHRKRHFATKW